VAQIDAPQLNYLHIDYLDEDLGTDYQIPELCKFIDRSDKLKLSHFRRADLTVEPSLPSSSFVKGVGRRFDFPSRKTR
jgi:hypothetical protein